jgi:Mrp family chromosome partitioning ATPase
VFKFPAKRSGSKVSASHFILPTCRSSHEFIDRAEDMEALERVLLPRAPPNRRQILILHGMGGIGKTQLAVEFARKHETSYSSVFFIDADSKDSLLRSFLAIYWRIAAGGLSKEEESANSLTQLEDVAKRCLIGLIQRVTIDGC